MEPQEGRRYDILSRYDDTAISFTVNPAKGKYAALTTAYEEMLICASKLTELRNNINLDFNPNGDISFSSPLEYGPRAKIIDTIHDCKEEFIKFVIQQLSSESIYKNLTVDEERILKQFGIGYGSIEKYGPGFQGKDVEACFKEMYPIDDIENIIYDQILESSKRSLPFIVGHKTTEIERFKDGLGVALSYCTSNYYGTNNNYTTSLIKLVELTLVPVKPSNAKSVYIEPGETYSSLSCTSIRGYKNGKLKILFKSKEDADTICNLLLQEDEKGVS